MNPLNPHTFAVASQTFPPRDQATELENNTRSFYYKKGYLFKPINGSPMFHKMQGFVRQRLARKELENRKKAREEFVAKRKAAKKERQRLLRIEREKQVRIEREKQIAATTLLQKIWREHSAHRKNMATSAPIHTPEGIEEAKGPLEGKKAESRGASKEPQPQKAKDTSTATPTRNKRKKKKKKKKSSQQPTAKKSSGASKEEDNVWKAIEAEAAANEAAKAEAAKVHRPLHVALSESFQRQVVEAAKTHDDFTQQHQVFLAFLHHSNIPMYPDLIRSFDEHHFQLYILHRTSSLTKEKIDAMLQKESHLPASEKEKIYQFIEEQLNAYSGTPGTPTLTIKTLQSFFNRMNTILQEYLAAIATPCNPIAVMGSQLDQKKEMISWVKAFGLSLQEYQKQVAAKLTIFNKNPSTTSAKNLWNKASQSSVHTSFQVMIDLFHRNPFHRPNFEAKMRIFERDLEPGGMFDQFLDQVVLPLYEESESPAAFASLWLKKYAHKEHADALAILKAPKPYHLLLLEEKIRDWKQKILTEKIGKTLNEAYRAGVITPWTRALPLNAIIANITDTLDQSLVDCEKDREKLKAWFKEQLVTVKDEMNVSHNAAEQEMVVFTTKLKSMLNTNGDESIQESKLTRSYGNIAGKVVTHIKATTKAQVDFPRRGIRLACEHFMQAAKLYESLKEAGVK